MNNLPESADPGPITRRMGVRLHVRFHALERRYRRAIVFPVKFAIWLIWMGACLAGIAAASSWSARLPWQLLIGLAFVHGVELQHQTLHFSGFRARALNRWAGFILGLPMLVCFSVYRDRHLFHHRKVGGSEDLEFFDYRRGLRAVLVLRNLLLIDHFANVLRAWGRALTGRREPMRLLDREAGNARCEYLLMALLVTLLVVAATAWMPSGLLMAAWLLPLIAVAAPVHALIELPEHHGCERSSDMFRNTRTITAGALMVWFTNGNNYHVEHHARAAVPMHRLRRVHRRIRHRIRYRSDSYWVFYRDFVSARLRPARSTS